MSNSLHNMLLVSSIPTGIPALSFCPLPPLKFSRKHQGFRIHHGLSEVMARPSREDQMAIEISRVDLGRVRTNVLSI